MTAAISLSGCLAFALPCRLRSELLPAARTVPVLPAGFGAVYAFALADAWSARCRARTVLKVGRTGTALAIRFNVRRRPVNGQVSDSRSWVACRG